MYCRLRYLKKRGFLVTRSDGRYIRYYVANNIGGNNKKIIVLLKQNIPYKSSNFHFKILTLFKSNL